MRAIRLIVKWGVRFVLLYGLFIVFFVLGSMAVQDVMPENAVSEPGLTSMTSGLLIVALANVLIIAALILTSRWSGWKLAGGLALAYYGAVTFVMQIETWYFLSSITVSPELLPRLFLMGVPTAFLFIPIAVWILGRHRASADQPPKFSVGMSSAQWIAKLSAIVIAYLVLYWGAGYFIAWQNPELRAFYGRPGEALPFLTHTADTLRHEPLLFPFQALRALLWVLCALPIIRGSKINPWWTALLVGLFFGVPQNIAHIIANPLLPIAGVRMSHLIETSSSTFVYGIIVVWLLHRKHDSLRDLIGFQLSTTTPSCK